LRGDCGKEGKGETGVKKFGTTRHSCANDSGTPNSILAHLTHVHSNIQEQRAVPNVNLHMLTHQGSAS